MIEIKAEGGKVDITMSGKERDVTAEMTLIFKDLAEAFAEHKKIPFGAALRRLCDGAMIINSNPGLLIKSETQSAEIKAFESGE